MSTISNPLASAPNPHGHVVSRAANRVKPAIHNQPNFPQQNYGTRNGTTPSLPPLTAPSYVNTKAAINSLPNLFSVYHG